VVFSGNRATLGVRQRAVVNGIWDIGQGVQVSGVYFFGSGERFRTSSTLANMIGLDGF